jgi:hypothetical protein
MSRILSGLLATHRNDVQRLRVGIGWQSRGDPKGANMKMHSVVLTSAALLINGMASAQQQYDSLGSPTPAPNQSTAPNSTRPNVQIPTGKSDDASGKAETIGTASTTGSATSTPSNGGVNGPVNTGTTTPTDPGATPSGLSLD